MILVDTSVLIGYFKGAEGIPYEKLEDIIERSVPFGICDYVYQELLQGARNEKEFLTLKDYLSSLQFYGLRNGRKSFENAAALYMLCRKNGITARSTVDMLIVEIALENNLSILHDDSDFIHIARVCDGLKLF